MATTRIKDLSITSEYTQNWSIAVDNSEIGTRQMALSTVTSGISSIIGIQNYSLKYNTISGLNASGVTITYTKGDGTTGSITTQDTWQANTKSQNGYVTAPSETDVNKVWGTDGSGNPGWTAKINSFGTAPDWKDGGINILCSYIVTEKGMIYCQGNLGYSLYIQINDSVDVFYQSSTEYPKCMLIPVIAGDRVLRGGTDSEEDSVFYYKSRQEQEHGQNIINLQESGSMGSTRQFTEPIFGVGYSEISVVGGYGVGPIRTGTVHLSALEETTPANPVAVTGYPNLSCYKYGTYALVLKPEDISPHPHTFRGIIRW